MPLLRGYIKVLGQSGSGAKAAFGNTRLSPGLANTACHRYQFSNGCAIQ